MSIFYKYSNILKRMGFKKFLDYLSKDRSYIDYWSLVHFGFGVLFGYSFRLIEWPFITSLFAVLSLFTFWEILEPMIFKYILRKKFGEDTINQVTDIIYGVLGLLVYWYWL